MDRERSRVLVAESLHRAAASANSGSLDAACALLAEAEAMLAASPSMQQRDPLCARKEGVRTHPGQNHQQGSKTF